MTINLPLTTESSAAHKNGIVGYDFDKIYERYPDLYAKNADRVKSIFKNDFTNLSARAIAIGQHAHKNELDKFGNQDIVQQRITKIEEDIATLSDQINDINQAQPGANAQIASLQAQIIDLNSKKANIEAKYAENFLLDTSINEVIDGNGNALGYDEGSDAAFNPDFPVETISYAYNKEIYISSERGSNIDGVVSGTKAPNVAYPNTGSSNYTSPKVGNGGFGVDPSRNSNNEGVLTSLQVTGRYQ